MGRPPPAAEDADGGASPVEAALEASGPALAPATGAWAMLPPIQRTVSDAPLVAPAAPFLADVPGHRPLPPIVQPLGHETARSAPAGLVVAHVSTVPSLTSHAPMPTRPVQRHGSDAADIADSSPGWSGEPVVPGSPSSAPVAPTAASPVPVRSLATVAPAATVTPAARPLTRSPEPVAVTQRSTGRSRAAAAAPAASTARPVMGSPSTPTVATAAIPGARPTPPPRGTGPARTVSRWAETTSSMAAAPTAGLGAPLTSAPDALSQPGIREMPTAPVAGRVADRAVPRPGVHEPSAGRAGRTPVLAAGPVRCATAPDELHGPATRSAHRPGCRDRTIHGGRRGCRVQTRGVRGPWNPGTSAPAADPPRRPSPLGRARGPRIDAGSRPVGVGDPRRPAWACLPALPRRRTGLGGHHETHPRRPASPSRRDGPAGRRPNRSRRPRPRHGRCHRVRPVVLWE